MSDEDELKDAVGNLLAEMACEHEWGEWQYACDDIPTQWCVHCSAPRDRDETATEIGREGEQP